MKPDWTCDCGHQNLAKCETCVECRGFRTEQSNTASGLPHSTGKTEIPHERGTQSDTDRPWSDVSELEIRFARLEADYKLKDEAHYRLSVEFVDLEEKCQRLADQVRSLTDLKNQYFVKIGELATEVERLREALEKVRPGIVVEHECEECGTFTSVKYEIKELKEAAQALKASPQTDAKPSSVTITRDRMCTELAQLDCSTESALKMLKRLWPDVPTSDEHAEILKRFCDKHEAQMAEKRVDGGSDGV